MLGIESGSQKVLDRLKKEQTLAEVETTVSNAKAAGIEIVHGFFVVGSPGETADDVRATFDFASRLALDTFGFNRLCVYRGTPLWHEYVERGLVDDANDWYKYFKCTEIDPTCLSGEAVNAERSAGLRRLFRYKIRHYPLQTLRPAVAFSPSYADTRRGLLDRQAVSRGEARRDQGRGDVARRRARGVQGCGSGSHEGERRHPLEDTRLTARAPRPIALVVAPVA